MGRKRRRPLSSASQPEERGASQSKMGRNRRPLSSASQPEERGASQSSTVVRDTFVWAKLRGCPMWPTKVVKQLKNSKVMRFVKSDNAEIPVNVKDIMPFQEQLNKLKNNGIGDGVFWGYDVLYKVCRRASLSAPDRITSTSLRKYMATLTQVQERQAEERPQAEEANVQDEIWLRELRRLEALRRRLEALRRQDEKERIRIGYEELRSGLIGFYSQSYETVEVSPLPQVGERSAKMLDIYVQPTMFQVETDRLKRAFNQNLSRRRKMKSYQDIFSKGGKCCKNIYITGEKGVGKSVFAKKMALAWCQAHSPKERDQTYFSEEDILEMQKFDLLFLLPLMNSDSLELCDIDDMILQQIFPRLDSLTVRSMDFLETILHERQYLVILDGLDQWSHPVSCRNRNSDIPHMKARENYTILTTTSPWKLEEVQLKSSQIDQHIEMMELEMHTADQLISYVLQHLRFTQREMSENLAQFHTFYEKYKMQTFISTPVMLMLLVCLWAEKRHVGMSRCEIYENIVDLLFRRVVLETSDETLRRISETCMHSPSQDNRLFLEVGKLAFYTAFSLQRESCLVFESMVVDQYLSRNILQVCLISGLLSRHESYESVLQKKSKISFLHKSIQEFFAAYYIQAASDPSYISDVILRRCDSVSAFLEMSNVFIFLSGLNQQIVKHVFSLLPQLLSANDVIQTYRNSLVTETFFREHNPDALIQVKELQTLKVSCVLESKANGSDLLQIGIQDIIVDKSSKEGSYNSALIDLVKFNSGSIKSVSFYYTYSSDMRCAKLIDVCGEQTSSLQKLIIDHFHMRPAEIENLLRSFRTLRCLSLRSESLSGISCEMIQRMSQLEALQLAHIMIPHKQMTDLLVFIEGRPNMRHISLVGVECEDNCAGHSLSLTQQSNLQDLSLLAVKLSDVRVNVTSLKELLFGPMSARVDLQLQQLLPGAANLQTLKVINPSDSSAVMRVLPRLQHLKCFKLLRCSIDDDTLELPMSGHLKELIFHEVKFKGQTLFNLLRRLESATGAQPIKLELNWGTVPEVESKRVREYVNSSPNFKLLDNHSLGGFNLSCQTTKFD